MLDHSQVNYTIAVAMKLHVVAVFLSLLLHLHGAELASEWHMNYTLVTANSPDCNSSLADDYPVFVLGNFTATGEWIKLDPQLGEPRYFQVACSDALKLVKYHGEPSFK